MASASDRFDRSHVDNFDHPDPHGRPWLAHYPQGVPASLTYPDGPAWRLLERAAADFPDRLAYHYYEEHATFAEVWERSRRVAALLRRCGLKPGERVAILLPNVPEYLTTLNGVWLAGGVAVAVSPLMVAEEVAALLEKTGCRFAVALDMLAPLVVSAESHYHPERTFFVTLRERLPRWQQVGYFVQRRRKTGHWRIASTDRLGWLDDELAGVTAADAAHEPVTATDNDPAYVLPTGGTTSDPKAVVLSHRNLIANAWQQRHWAEDRRGEDVFLGVLPFFHSYGLSACLMTGVAMGATIVIHHRFGTRTVIELIERHRPTAFHAVPAMLAALNDFLKTHPADLGSLRWCISGGSSLEASVAEAFASHCPARLVQGYGLSEASPVTHVGPLDGSDRPGTIGLPLPDTDARIVDAQTGTETLPSGAVGELVVRGPQVMLGYWNAPELTARAVRDGWLHTGDLAVCDEQGFFRIVDRKKDLIITSGFNVYPADVESVLRSHKDIADAAVIGVPDDHRGQIVKAVLVPRPGAEINVAEIEHYCREHLSAHKRPHLFEVVDELPKNFLGKVIRRHLREAATETAAS